MPLYEYECDACSKRFEVIQKFSESPDRCRVCGKGPVRRLMSSPAIQFKGTGWYITDYANKGKSEGKSGGENGSGAAKAEGKYRGRVPTARRRFAEVLDLHRAGVRPDDIAARLAISRSSVFRALREERMTGPAAPGM